MNKMYMFSYGMNTNIQQMGIRCPRSTSLGAAILEGYRFRFANHADVVPDPGSTVTGVLWEITLDCLANLDLLEGYPYYYDRKMVEVSCAGKKFECLVYTMQPGNTSAPPSNTYLNLITEGYLQHGIDCNQLTDELAEFDK
jgi:gamma-glutamylcyclotransferase (GGCT)/AIG2-like uncharacterized protein YtfP